VQNYIYGTAQALRSLRPGDLLCLLDVRVGAWLLVRQEITDQKTAD
jgi:hypothetical protein